MFVIVEQVFFYGDDCEVVDVLGPYESEADATALVESLKRLDRQNDRVREGRSVDYTVMPLNMF